MCINHLVVVDLSNKNQAVLIYLNLASQTLIFQCKAFSGVIPFLWNLWKQIEWLLCWLVWMSLHRSVDKTGTSHVWFLQNLLLFDAGFNNSLNYLQLRNGFSVLWSVRTLQKLLNFLEILATIGGNLSKVKLLLLYKHFSLCLLLANLVSLAFFIDLFLFLDRFSIQIDLNLLQIFLVLILVLDLKLLGLKICGRPLGIIMLMISARRMLQILWLIKLSSVQVF